MKWNELLPPFEHFPSVVRVLTTGFSAEMLRWRPKPGAWSVLEICVHLLDEEREDFRARMQSTLEDPARAWEPIDPERWVQERAYQERDLDEVLDAFAEERARSVALLRGLRNPTWENTFRHQALGALRAGDLLASWLSHDALHLRQLSRRMFERVRSEAAPFSTGYAAPPDDWASA